MRATLHVKAITILFFLITACGSDDENIVPGAGQFNLKAKIYSTRLYGIYEKGIPLNEENYIVLDISVKEAGPYKISTVDKNGYHFTASGEFTSIRSTNLKLQGVGTPTGEQLDVVQIASSESQTEVEVQVVSNLSNKIIITSGYTFDEEYKTMAVTGRSEVLWEIPEFSDYGAVKDQVFYFNGDSALTAVDIITGSVKWTNDSLGNMTNLTLSDNVLYTSSEVSDFYAVDAINGEIIWLYNPPSTYVSSSYVPSGAPVVAGNIVYFSEGEKIHAVNKVNGTLSWQNTAASTNGTPVLNNGILYLSGGYDGTFALNATDGSILWNSNIQTFDSPYLSEGRLFINGGSTTYCLNAQTGEVIWNKPIKDLAQSPVVYEGKVFVTTDFGLTSIHSINATDSTTLWGSVSEGFAESEIVAHQGMLYLGTTNSLNGHYLNSGKLMTVFGGLAGDNRLGMTFYAILAAYDRDSEEVAYPTNSGH